MSRESGDTRAQSSGHVHQWVISAVSVVLLLLSGVIAIVAGAFDVERVDFGGLHRVSYDEAYRAAGIRPGDFMGTLDADGAREALSELPWVRTAEIGRHWPRTVEIDIVERVPAALALIAPDSWVLVDSEGRVLTTALASPPSLPRLSGISAAPAPGRYLAPEAGALLDVLDTADGQPGFAVAAVWRDRRGDVRARISRQPDGAVFEAALGDDSAIGAKTAAIAAVVSDLAPSGAILDVSVPHLPVVRAEDR
ncbi:cell division protein FtsQ/DivIB [Candidatus Poriferisodalis sp.]|uniref:cell division protein FtsQ/DivIB n=1 Tax=Candidatus Poriferisodalis sp. TaxID=3101277 RepID=UPI003B02C6D4